MYDDNPNNDNAKWCTANTSHNLTGKQGRSHILASLRGCLQLNGFGLGWGYPKPLKPEGFGALPDDRSGWDQDRGLEMQTAA